MTNFIPELGERGGRKQWMRKQSGERVGANVTSERRSLWAPNVPSSFNLGEASSSTPSGLKIKERWHPDSFASSFLESLGCCEGQKV